MIDLAAGELAELAALLERQVGLDLRSDGFAALRLALSARYGADDRPPVPPRGYLRLLDTPEGEEELRRLLPLVTVGKTSFFRDERQFGALRALLPALLGAARAGGRPAAIWSAGCATGEEPWSIAMAAAEAGAAPGELELLASDVNPQAVAAASRARYPPRRMRDVPPALVAEHFEPDGDAHRVKDALRALCAGAVTHNLVAPDFPRPRAGRWHVIFCRNVIIYFDTPTTRAVLARLFEALAPGGWLFLGHSESLFRLFDGFELTEVAGAFLYRRPEGHAGPAPVPDRPGARYTPARVTHAGAAGPAAADARSPAERPRFSSQQVLDAAVQLLAAGRFVAARERLAAHLAEGGGDLGVKLTLAYLHAVLQDPAEAEAVYRSALAQEPLSAEPHLLFGMHLFGEGRLDEAAQELGRALLLDPELTLGHYFLGRCREAQRDAERARLAYRAAVEAAERQPAGRRQPFVGHYPDLPEDGAAFARAAEYALAALRGRDARPSRPRVGTGNP